MMRTMTKVVFAFDKQTHRSRDADGRMRVSDCVLSVAEINPYRGAEIPKREELGLDANEVYDLYRDPEELGSPEAIASFQGIPLMLKHIPQTAEEPRKEYQCGSVFNVRFDGKKLRGDLLVTDGMAIDLIESDKLSDLSCGYRYYPVMVPGKANGQSYDGRMTQIRGNHVALVEDGRATGAHVADSAFVDPRAPNPTMQGDSNMAFPEQGGAQPGGSGAPPAAAAPAPQDNSAALLAAIKQLTEQNAQAHQAILAKLGGGADAAPPAAVPAASGAPAEPADPQNPGAQDFNLELGHQGPKGAEDNEHAEDEDEEEGEEERKGAMDNESDVEPNGEKDPQGAEPAPTGTGPRGGETPFGAMDARMKKAVEVAIKQERKRNADANEAKREVAGILGGDLALDSAAEIYREALAHAGVDVNDVPAGAEKAAWQGFKAARAAAAGVMQSNVEAMAMDSAAKTSANTKTAQLLSKIKIRA
jgi:uncharacterized protein